jgi:hypothetical protein
MYQLQLRGIMKKELTNNVETAWLFRGLAIGCCLFFVIISFVLDCIIGVGRTAGLGCVSPLMGPFALLFGNFLRYCGFVYWLIALFVVFAPVFTGWLLRRHQLIRELLFFIFVVLWNFAGFLGLFLCMER